MTVYVIGHKSPDTDTVVSTVAYAYLLNSQGVKAEPVIQDPITPETKFVLEKFNIRTPEIMRDVAGRDLAVVDTADFAQLPHDVADANILYIVDHHQLGGLRSKGPVEVWMRPVGCTSTILEHVFDFYGVAIPSDIAGAMMCAILSDTILFKSPTTTDVDRKAVEKLEKKSGLNPLEIGMEMLRVKSSIDGVTARELIMRDFKDFSINGKKMGVGQSELIDSSMATHLFEDIKAELKVMATEGGYFGMIFLITDIMREGSIMIAYCPNHMEKLGEIYGVNFEHYSAWIDGMLSRKKQVIPPLEKNL